MRWFIGSSPEETFRSLMIYFNGKHVKITARNRPSYIKAEIGSGFSFADEGNAKGEVEAKITKGNGGSYVYLNFDFTKEYALVFAAAVLGAFSFCIIGSFLFFASSLLRSLEPGLIASSILIGLLVEVMAFPLIIKLEGYAASRTKKRFMEEFNMLMQLLSA